MIGLFHGIFSIYSIDFQMNEKTPPPPANDKKVQEFQKTANVDMNPNPEMCLKNDEMEEIPLNDDQNDPNKIITVDINGGEAVDNNENTA